MKKIARIVWISALSGLAFLSACVTQNGLTRKERKQLVKEREQVETELAQCEKVTDLPREREFYSEYMEYFEKKYALENKIDSINYRLGDSIDLDRNVRRRQILQRIDSLTFLIETYDAPLVYGPPVQMGGVRIKGEDYIWQRQLNEAKTELDDFDRAKTQGAEIYEALYGVPVIHYDDPQPAEEERLQEGEQRKLDSIQRKKELQQKRDSIRQTRRDDPKVVVYGPPPMSQQLIQRREEIDRRCKQLQQEMESLEAIITSRDGMGAFGSPEEMEEYGKVTDSLRNEWNKKDLELSRLKHERKARGL